MPPKKGSRTNVAEVTSIERMGLDTRIRELYAKGYSRPKIFATLKAEGHEVNKHTLNYWISTRIVSEKKEELAAGKKQKTVLQEASAELKLTEAVKEAWENYEKCKHDDDSVGASTWFRHYNELIEKLLKSTGVYEKAKQDAQKDDDKKIEVVWVVRTICDKCKEQLSEVEQMHTVTTMKDLQTEDVKEQIVEELSVASVETDGASHD